MDLISVEQVTRNSTSMLGSPMRTFSFHLSGELLDRITILRIKQVRILDAPARQRGSWNLRLLEQTWRDWAARRRTSRSMSRAAERQRAPVGHRGSHPRRKPNQCFDRDFIEPGGARVRVQ